MTKKILFIVDPQNDFISGSLEVKGAEDIMNGLARYIERYGNEYELFAVSCDSHPINHCSFKENGGEWPIHCVVHSVGAAVYQPILNALNNHELKDKKIVAFIEKGKVGVKEEYSAVDTKRNQEHVSILLKAFNIEQIDICGICGDICVLNTIKGLVDMDLKENLNVLEEFCPSLDDGSTLHNYLIENNIKYS